MADLLAWNKFYKDFKTRKKNIVKSITDFNRLIAYSKNFFCIAGYGAFIEGYFIIITKKLLPSFSDIKQEQIAELEMFISLIKKIINDVYDKDCVVFEHGMCSCVGGLDRAHIHLMPINKKTSKYTITSKINKVLKKRCVGIEEINYLNTQITHPHDIKHIFNEVDHAKLKIKGKILNLKDIQNLKINFWPLKINKKNSFPRSYIYFNAGKNKNFLTLENIETQLGREIIFEIELVDNKKLKKKYEENKLKFPEMEMWRWQHFRFDQNILNTINKSQIFLKNKNKLLKELKIINAL